MTTFRVMALDALEMITSPFAQHARFPQRAVLDEVVTPTCADLALPCPLEALIGRYGEDAAALLSQSPAEEWQPSPIPHPLGRTYAGRPTPKVIHPG
ncbi:MAG: hypothetical protein IPL78_33720 [Chloroflexi bacterium]|nr:hypothetical protein [Chloroflexota bacterium]